MSKGTIKKVAGPLVIAEGMRDANMYDVVRVSNQRLIGEIIEMHGDEASIQVYEETSGLRPGEPVESTEVPLSVELGPGLITSIYDGIQRPLDDIMKATGSNSLKRGVEVPALKRDKKWEFVPVAKAGDEVEVVVGPLCTIHHRSALYCHKSTVGLHLAIGTHRARLHVEVHAHHVTLLPLAVDGEVAVSSELALHLHSVNLDAVLRTEVVAVFIQVAWHYLIAHPSRNTNLHCPLSSLVGSHLDCDVTIPGVFRSLLNSHFLTFHVKC